MDFRGHHVAHRLVHEAVPLYRVEAGKPVGDDDHGEMSAAGGGAGVPPVQVGIIGNVQFCGSKGLLKTQFYFFNTMHINEC